MVEKVREIAGYSAAELIGQGGFGAVFRAADPEHDRHVAIKLLPGRLNDDERRRFDRERQAMGRLGAHPYIVPVYDSGYTEAGEGYIVMELATGGTLRDRIDGDGPMPWDLATRYLILIAEAVQFAHDQGVLHRDIKPDNILVNEVGFPKLSDFGIAAVLDNETATTATTATLAHAAPEMLDGVASAPAVDVYALGSTLHTLLSGIPPFMRRGEEANMALLINRLVTTAPPDLRPLGVPDEVATVIERALAKDPAHRQPTAAALANELRACLGTEVEGLPSLGAPSLDTPGSPTSHPAPPSVSPSTPPPGTTALSGAPATERMAGGPGAASDALTGGPGAASDAVAGGPGSASDAVAGGPQASAPAPTAVIDDWVKAPPSPATRRRPTGGAMAALIGAGVAAAVLAVVGLGWVMVGGGDDGDDGGGEVATGDLAGSTFGPETEEGDVASAVDAAEEAAEAATAAAAEAAAAAAGTAAEEALDEVASGDDGSEMSEPVDGDDPASATTTAPAAPVSPGDADPTIEIDCPDQVAMDRETSCTILTSGITSGTWRLPAFQVGDAPLTVGTGRTEIVVEPIAAEMLGRSFTLTVSGSTADGRAISAEHVFTVVAVAIEIDCPAEIAVGTSIVCEIVTANAADGEWRIPGFGGDVLTPDRTVIFIEPTDEANVGRTFTLTVDARSADGEVVTATATFVVTA